VETLLFYLTDKPKSCGTTVFVPKKPFRCDGRKHHKFEDFEVVKTAPFLPNSFYGHVRSDVSFHGVFKTTEVRHCLAITYRD